MAMAPTNHTICFLLLLITLLVISPCLSAGDTNVLFSDLGGGNMLDTNQNLVYNEGYYKLSMQPNCNLCLYHGGKLNWSTNTAQLDKLCQVKLQPNSELVLSGIPMNGPNEPEIIWWSGNRNPDDKYALVLNYEGSLGIYGPPIWSVPKPPKVKSAASTDRSSGSLGFPVTRVEPTFWVGDQAGVGTVMANGDYKLVLDENCNLTLSNDKTTLWFTNTTNANSYDCFVTLEENGLLHIKYRGGASVWNSGLKGPDNSEYVLALRPDGYLAIYGGLKWKPNPNEKTDNGKKIAMVTEE